MYNNQSRKKHYNKQQKSKFIRLLTKLEDSKWATTQYKSKKQKLTLRELDDHIRTVIAEKVSQKIF